MVTGHVRGDLPGHPWAGTAAMLGPDRVILGEDGAFSFAVKPGRYHLKVCCSPYFQAIDRDVVVEKSDIVLDLQPNALMEIKGRLEIQGRTKVPYGLNVLAALEGTNVVDRAVTAEGGTFALHLSTGTWEIRMDSLPAKYRIASIRLGDKEVRDRKLTLAKGAASLPLRIALQ